MCWDNVKKHLTQEGLEQIVTNKTDIKFGVSYTLMLSFSIIIPLIRPTLIPNNELLNPYKITGFVEGYGTFLLL
jgi:hypothetical protein